MTKADEPREKHQKWTPAGTGSAPTTTFAGYIMALVALMLLFDDDEDSGKPTD